MNKEMVEAFKVLLGRVERTGMDKLMDFIDKSDFYTAPASTGYHLAKEGGLLEHTMNVYNRLVDKYQNDPYWKEVLKDVPYESIILVSLLHDAAKIFTYVPEMKNVKVDGKWEQIQGYKFVEKIPLPHGAKSCFIVERYIKLSMQEYVAIYHHMGAYISSDGWNTLGNAIEKYPLVLALHQADMEASKIIEKG